MAAVSRKRKIVPTLLSGPALKKVKEEEKVDNLQRAVRRLKKASSAEQHMLVNASAITYSNAGTVTYLSTIVQGDDVADRSGTAISPILFKYRHAIVGTANAQCRQIIFQDNSNAGALPAVLDVLQTAAVNSDYNVVNQMGKRFRILRDWVFTIGPTTVSANILYQRKINKLNKINFLGTTAAIASAGRGALFLLRVTDLAASQPTDSFNWTLKFNP